MGLKMPRSAMIKESLLSARGQTFVLLLCDRAGWWRLVGGCATNVMAAMVSNLKG